MRAIYMTLKSFIVEVVSIFSLNIKRTLSKIFVKLWFCGIVRVEAAVFAGGNTVLCRRRARSKKSCFFSLSLLIT